MDAATKKKFAVAAVVGLGAMTLSTSANAAVVINEIYGGGGFTATSSLPASLYANDFVELYNNGTAAVDISGYLFRYGSPTSATMSPTSPSTSGGAAIPAGTILRAGGTYLIAGAGAAATTTGAGVPLPTPDLTVTSVNLGAAAGRVGLFDGVSNVAIDFVGYGTTATAYEGTAPATGPGAVGFESGITSINRVLGVDTNSNSADFVLGAPTPTPSSVVPEPATLGLAAAAGSLLIGRRRR